MSHLLSWPFALGCSAPAKVLGTISADRLLVELTGEAIEIDLVLLGLRTGVGTGANAHRLTSAADWLDTLVRRFKSRGTDYLPRPVHTTRFIRTLADGGIFAGLIFMTGDDQSLNSRAADARICGVDPDCPYLRSRWQPTRRASV